MSEFPRAYLRMSPNLDQHADPLGMVLLLCTANRQTDRGRFATRGVLNRAVGRRRAQEMVERGDVVLCTDGRFYVDGWDEWQEGDLTVAERMRLLRRRKAANRHPVTPVASPRRNDVTTTANRDSPPLVSTPSAIGVGVGDKGLTATPKSGRPQLVAVSPVGEPA
jgi:hypothetical protein